MRLTNTARYTGYPPIICIEDREHTARCVMAIRERKRREAMAHLSDGGPR
jgi:hypothetical protein